MVRNPPEYQVAVIGAGIVGLATARAVAARAPVQRTVTPVVVLEAETAVGRHQTGNNSGVIHSGLYYKPGSLKARTCTIGREAMYRFCAEQGIPHERCGKLVVATDQTEVEQLRELEQKGRANGLEHLEWIEADRVQEYEPHACGVAALRVPDTGIVDYGEVVLRLAEGLVADGVDVRTAHRVVSVAATRDRLIIETERGEISARYLVNCAGLQSDRVARSCGVSPDLKIVPFRGEYHALVPEKQHLVRNLIYPVPDPRFPFLGVHFTRTIGGQVEAGPNAVLALKREGYGWRNVSPRDTVDMLSYPGFWRVLGKYWRTGSGEIVRSVSKGALVSALRRLIPELTADDIRRHGAGVRAQAVGPDGALVDDFRVLGSERMVHVLNAPSPAATAAFPIGEMIADMLDEVMS